MWFEGSDEGSQVLICTLTDAWGGRVEARHLVLAEGHDVRIDKALAQLMVTRVWPSAIWLFGSSYPRRYVAEHELLLEEIGLLHGVDVFELLDLVRRVARFTLVMNATVTDMNDSRRDRINGY